MSKPCKADIAAAERVLRRAVEKTARMIRADHSRAEYVPVLIAGTIAAAVLMEES